MTTTASHRAISDWRNGKLPPVEDIKTWTDIIQNANRSTFGIRVTIPAEFYEFTPYIAQVKYDYGFFGPETCSRIFGTPDMWTAIRNRWIHELRSSPLLRKRLASQGLHSELSFEEFKEAARVAAVKIAPGAADREAAREQANIPPAAAASATLIETPSQIGNLAHGSPAVNQSSGSRATLSGIAQTRLPGQHDSVCMGSGRSCGIIGQGGMATVYRIYNETLEIYRAVKIMLFNRLGGGEEELLSAMSRIETEAKIWAKLHHNNIVQVHDFGQWNGLPFLEMELVEGSDLKGLVNRRGKLPLEVVTAIGIDVARALGFAHRQSYRIHGESYKGLIHRDIKPQNILCSKTGEIKLADFGLAKPQEYNVHTMTGNFVGTPKYAAPEQLLSSPLDARSDIYSLGAVLYEMVAGQELFPQDTVMAVLAARQANTYKPLQKARKGIQRDLHKIVEKCLSQRPDERFRSATALLESLEDCHSRITKERPEAVLEEYVIDRKLLAGKPGSRFNRRGFFG